MKKKNFLFSVCICFLLSMVFSGCSKITDVSRYNTTLITEMNGIASATVGTPDQAFQASALYQREGAASELTVSFDGETYTGTYSFSVRTAGAKTVQDYYWVNEIVLCNQFGVSSIDNELTSIIFYGPQPFGLREIEKDLSQIGKEEIEKKALEWAKKWISEEGYSFYLGAYTPPQGGSSGSYQYRYCRMIGEIETTDCVNINITDRGTLAAITTGELGWTKKHQSELDAFSVEAAIEAAKKASGLSSPTVKETCFGITPDDRVFLRVFLVGSEGEAPVVLAVTLD